MSRRVTEAGEAAAAAAAPESSTRGGGLAALPPEGGLAALRVRRVEGAPVAAVRVWLEGGARRERVPGQALVTGRLLAEGTRRHGWREIADRVEARGIVLRTGATFESHGASIDALADDWAEALALAAEIVLEPSFPADRATWIAKQAAAELDSLGDQPEVRTAFGFLDQLYAPHRRALPLHGTAASLASLTPADCAAFHLDRLVGGVRVAVAGTVDEEAVEGRVCELFGGAAGVARTAGAEPTLAPGSPGTGDRRRTVELLPPDEGEPGQAHLYVGAITVPRAHPDHDALELAAVVLGAGAGLTGRVPERVREREGLAYTATCHTVAGSGLDPGRLVAYVGTAPETVGRAERAVVEELRRIVDDGVSDAELEEARSYLLGREPFRRETARQWADLLTAAEHYGLPLDRPGWRETRLAALTRGEVEAAVRRWVRPDELRVTVGLPGRASR